MSDVCPRWNLSDLYASPDSETLLQDKKSLSEDVHRFTETYKGRIANISVKDLSQAIAEYDALQDRLSKISGYADLLYATNTTDNVIGAHYQNLQEYLNDESSKLVFFTLDINLLSDEAIEAFVKYDAHYAPWLRDVRAFKDYQLNEEIEQLLIDKSLASNTSWIRLYEDMFNRMNIAIDSETLTLPQALDLLSNPQEGKRKQAAFALSDAFKEVTDNTALIYNTLIKDNAIDDKWRGFKRPVSSRNLANLVEDDIVDTLAQTVKDNYTQLSERYYRLKAGWLGKTRLDYWDRNAPLSTTDDKRYSWQQSKDIVLQAYQDFSPVMAQEASRFFDHNWIDVPVEAGKTSGAFSHPVSPSSHPYILLNHQGKIRDIITLAHELGHGVHQLLAAEQGALMADTPLTLAETASVFGEQLTFQYLLKHEDNETVRRQLIAGKVEDMLNTVVRQIAFYHFESEVHAARAKGEVAVEDISRLWMETQQASFGDAIHLDESYRYYWTYVSHFFHTPFYVYAYAFGDCLVNSLYSVYEDHKKAGQTADFEQKYLTMLRAGGSLRHKELLAPFNLDISTPDFWQKGLNHIASMIDMLEA